MEKMILTVNEYQEILFCLMMMLMMKKIFEIRVSI